MYVIERVIIHLWLSPISELYSNFLNLREIQRLWNVKVLVAQSLPTLCGPMDYVAPGSSVHGIFQARILEWVALPFSRGSSQPRDRTWVSSTAGRYFTVWATKVNIIPKSWKLLRIDYNYINISITDSMDMSLSKLWEIVKDREPWCAAIHGFTKSWTQLSDWTTKMNLQ